MGRCQMSTGGSWAVVSLVLFCICVDSLMSEMCESGVGWLLGVQKHRLVEQHNSWSVNTDVMIDGGR